MSNPSWTIPFYSILLYIYNILIYFLSCVFVSALACATARRVHLHSPCYMGRRYTTTASTRTSQGSTPYQRETALIQCGRLVSYRLVSLLLQNIQALHGLRKASCCRFLFYQMVQYLKMKPAGLMTNLSEECANSAMAASESINRSIILLPVSFSKLTLYITQSCHWNNICFTFRVTCSSSREEGTSEWIHTAP